MTDFDRRRAARVSEFLESLMLKNPNFTLGQLISIASQELGDLFYKEDMQILLAIDDAIERMKIEVSGR